MPVITIDIMNIYSRQNPIRKLLRPLRKAQDVGCSLGLGKYGGGKVVAAHDGSVPGGDPREWFFRTFAPGVWGQYFELWKPFDGDRRLLLDRAYFHVFTYDNERTHLRQLLSIHCDPASSDKLPLRTYKIGPHLHVVAAEKPLPRSHFPLNLGHLDEVLSSLNSLTKAMQSAVRVISDEVLKRMG